MSHKHFIENLHEVIYKTKGNHSFIFMTVRHHHNLKMGMYFLDLSSSKHFGFCTLQISCGMPHACFVCITVATTLYFLQVLQHSDRYYALPYALLSFVTLSSSLKGCPVFAHRTSFETEIHMRNLGGQ